MKHTHVILRNPSELEVYRFAERELRRRALNQKQLRASARVKEGRRTTSALSEDLVQEALLLWTQALRDRSISATTLDKDQILRSLDAAFQTAQRTLDAQSAQAERREQYGGETGAEIEQRAAPADSPVVDRSELLEDMPTHRLVLALTYGEVLIPGKRLKRGQTGYSTKDIAKFLLMTEEQIRQIASEAISIMQQDR